MSFSYSVDKNENEDKLHIIKIISQESLQTELQPKQVASPEDKICKERLCLLYHFLSCVVAAFSSFHAATLILNYPNIATPNTLMTLRMIGILSYSLVKIYMDGNSLPSLSKVKMKKWLYIRCSTAYFLSIVFIYGCKYIRLSTLNCFISLNPILVVVLSVLMLGEKFYMRYAYGIIICFSGAALILLNEGKNTSTNSNNSLDGLSGALIGLIVGALMIFLYSFMLLGIKILSMGKENLNFSETMFYFAVINLKCTIIYYILFGEFQNLLMSLWCSISGIVNGLIIMLAQLLLQMSYENIEMGKLTPIGYSQMVVSFILGAVFLNQSVHLLDIIGSLIIFGYNVYNAYYPIKDED